MQVKEDYERNAGLKDIGSRPPLPGCPLRARQIRPHVCSPKSRSMIPVLPVPDKHSSAVRERGQAVRNGIAYSGFSHIWKEEEGGEYVSRKKLKLQVIWPSFLLPARGSKLVMQAVFLFMLSVQIDLTTKQRDASRGKAGLLIGIVYHHPYTHFSSHRKVYTVCFSGLRKSIFCYACEDLL